MDNRFAAGIEGLSLSLSLPLSLPLVNSGSLCRRTQTLKGRRDEGKEEEREREKQGARNCSDCRVAACEGETGSERQAKRDRQKERE